MGKFLSWLLCASISPVGFAAEIVAWKASLSLFAFDGLETEGIVRSQSPPEPSVFFNDGDELWDLKGATDDHRFETEPPLEWVVWNQTTGRLVTKSDWNGVSQLYRQLHIHKLPLQCRLTAEVFEVPADGSPPSPDSTPAATLAWVARTGNEFQSSARRESNEITVFGTADIGESNETINLNLKVGFTVRGLPRREATFTGTSRDASPLWAVRDHDGESGLDLQITARVELLDGSPLSEAVVVEKNGAPVALIPDRSKFGKTGVENGRWLASAHLPPASLGALVRDKEDRSDPFAPPWPDPFHNRNPGLDEIQPPAALTPWLDGAFWDLRESLANFGIMAGQDPGFAGYDLLRQRILLFTDSQDGLEKFEETFDMDWTEITPGVVVNLGPERRMRLITRSGQNATLTRTTADGTVLASLSVEPTVGERDDLIDLRLELRESAGGSYRSFHSSVTLTTGRPAEIITGLSPDDPPVRVTGDLIRHSP